MTDVLGWAGSALLVYSLLQERVLRFRLLNLGAALVLVAFNAAVAVWPMVAMNVVIAAINAWHLARLLRTRHDDRQYDVVAVGPDEPYLRHLLQQHGKDIERFNPGALRAGPPAGLSGGTDDLGTELLAGAEVRRAGTATPAAPAAPAAPAGAAGAAGAPGHADTGGPAGSVGGDRLAFLVLTGGETVGVVLAHRTAFGEAQVDLDYVVPRFRDFTPGEFVYRRDGAFTRQGVWRVVAPRRMREADGYLARIGFRRSGDDLALDLLRPEPGAP